MKPIDELEMLIQTLDNPNRGAMIQALERVKAQQIRRTKILELVQEAIAQLRLDIKYLVFDLEATRRERDQLKK